MGLWSREHLGVGLQHLWHTALASMSGNARLYFFLFLPFFTLTPMKTGNRERKEIEKVVIGIEKGSYYENKFFISSKKVL